MSNLIRRMQRSSRRTTKGARKYAVTHQFATKLGVYNPKAKDLLARQVREENRRAK